jgi:hypothetical protein
MCTPVTQAQARSSRLTIFRRITSLQSEVIFIKYLTSTADVPGKVDVPS